MAVLQVIGKCAGWRRVHGDEQSSNLSPSFGRVGSGAEAGEWVEVKSSGGMHGVERQRIQP